MLCVVGNRQRCQFLHQFVRILRGMERVPEVGAMLVGQSRIASQYGRCVVHKRGRWCRHYETPVSGATWPNKTSKEISPFSSMNTPTMPPGWTASFTVSKPIKDFITEL